MLFSLGIHIINYIIINFVFYYDSSLILILSSLSIAVLIYYGNKFNIVGCLFTIIIGMNQTHVELCVCVIC